MNERRSALLQMCGTYPFPLVRGRGDRVWDDAGNEYIDLYGGHCVCSTGHSHPEVVDAIRRQAESLLFYSTAARVPVRDEAARALVEFAPDGLDQVFFSNSGAEANENALKAAVLATGRTRFVCFEGAFHGRTALALAVTDGEKMRAPFASFLASTTRLPFDDQAALDRAPWGEVAAVITEPVQSIAGVRMASREWLRALRRRTEASGGLLVFDEVQTGVGRLGTPFAADYFGVLPDIVTMAKGIASGVPLGATLMSDRVAAALSPGDLGSTFGGCPTACAALGATLAVVRREDLVARARRLGSRNAAEAVGGVVAGVRGAGLLLGLHVPGHAGALKAHLLAQRILVGGAGDPDVLRLMPPLTLTDESVTALVTALRAYDAAAGLARAAAAAATGKVEQ